LRLIMMLEYLRNKQKHSNQFAYQIPQLQPNN